MEIIAFLLLIAAVAAGVFIYRANKGRAASGEPTSGRRVRPGGEPTIEDVGPGGVFSLRAVGPDMEDLDVTVEARHVYSENGFEWFELEGDAGDRKVWVTVERDDELKVSVTLRKLRLDDLGLTKKQLKRFDDKERGGFSFEGKEYVYDDSDKAVLHRNGDRDSREAFYYWEFETRDGGDFITVERWEDGSFECHVSQPVRPSRITVYSASGGT